MIKVKAKRVKNGFLIPLVKGLEDKEEIEVEIKGETTEFVEFLKKIYSGKENISKTSDEEALEDALRYKYGL